MPKLLSIQCLSTGSSPKLQSKTVSPQTYSQTITADSGYDGLSNVIINAFSQKSQGLFYKILTINYETSSISIDQSDWTYYSNSSIKMKDWSITGNILYMQGDSTSNQVVNSIKGAVFINTGRTKTNCQLITIYTPYGYNMEGTPSAFSYIRWEGNALSMNVNAPYVFVGNYILMSVGLV